MKTDDDSLDQETVLILFLNAKILQAETELEQAERFHRLQPGPYTVGRVQWLGHKLAALRELRRDAERPGQIIARYLKATEAKCRQNPDSPTSK